MEKKKLKLASDNKVKHLPKARNSVKAALLRAADDAKENDWNRVFIVGYRDKDGYTQTRHSPMTDEKILTMLELSKLIIYKDL